jgi:hypothetical protein
MRAGGQELLAGAAEKFPARRPESCSTEKGAHPSQQMHTFLIYRGERIRTSDLSVPNRALYQAEPRPVKL